MALTSHGPKDDERGGDDMPAIREWLVGEECVFDDFSADVVLKGNYR